MTAFLEKANWVDILVVILLIRGCYVGFSKGLRWEFFRFLGYIAAVLGAIYYYESIAESLGAYLPVLYPFSNLLSFSGLYLIILFISKGICALAAKIIQTEVVSAFQRLTGFLSGLARGFILSALLLISFIFTALPYFEKSIRERSYSGQAIVRIAPVMYEWIATVIPCLKADGRNEALLELTGPDYKPPHSK